MNEGKIYGALARVMADVGTVSKRRKNQQQGYQFRGVDDVVAHVQDVMAEHGVVCVPCVLEREREMVATKSGGQMASVRLLVAHHFYAEDGSSVTCTTLGEAMDSGDKASNKAMSAALKYALTETLLIPTYEVERDIEEASPQMAPPSPPRNVFQMSAPKEPSKWEVKINEAPNMSALMELGALLAKEPEATRNAMRPLFTARHAEFARLQK